MKKVLSTLLVAGMFAFYACGPSAEDKAAAEKATQDSINAAQAAVQAVQSNTMTDTAVLVADTAIKK